MFDDDPDSINRYRLRVVESVNAEALHGRREHVAELQAHVMRRIALKIGEYILNKTAEVSIVEDTLRNTYNFKAEFYAVPLKAVKTERIPMFQVVAPSPQYLPPPPKEFKIETLMQVFDDAYNVSFMDSQDQLPPERRGMMAVLEYISEKF